MRIGIFSDTYTPDINGVVSSIVTLQESLIDQGHEVFIITTRHGLITLEFNNNILRLPGIELKRMYGYVLTTPIQIRAYRQVKDMKLDIIHVHTEFGVGVFGHMLSKMLKLPIVSTYHTTYEDYTHYVNTFNIRAIEKLAKKTVVRLSRMFGSLSNVIIAPSIKTKEMLMRYGIKREIVVIPTGLDLEKFDNINKDTKKIEQLKQKANLQPGDKVVVYVGRLAKEKSIDIVLKGFKNIANKNEFIKLIVVGSGPAEQELKELSKQLGLKNSVTFLGKVNSSEIPNIYHMADAFVSASITETQGLTYIEAMASGLIVFARYDDAISDIVLEKETGYFFSDEESLAQVVINYFNLDHAHQLKMQKSAKEKVILYDKRTFAGRMIEAYHLAQRIHSSTYRIEKIKYRNDYANIELVNPYDKIEVTIFSNTSKERGYEQEKMISKEELAQLLEDEKKAVAYKECIKMLSYKDRTRKEMYDILMKKTALDAYEMNEIIEILQKQNLINDEKIVEEKITSMREKLVGRHKVILELRQRGVPNYMIDKYLVHNEVLEEKDNALIFAKQLQDIVKEPSAMAKKDTIRRRLIHRGFDSFIAEHVVNELDFSVEIKNEKENCRAYAQKIKSQLDKRSLKDEKSKKRKLAASIARKGFNYELIKEVLSELEGELNNNDH